MVNIILNNVGIIEYQGFYHPPQPIKIVKLVTSKSLLHFKNYVCEKKTVESGFLSIFNSRTIWDWN